MEILFRGVQEKFQKMSGATFAFSHMSWTCVWKQLIWLNHDVHESCKLNVPREDQIKIGRSPAVDGNLNINY